MSLEFFNSTIFKMILKDSTFNQYKADIFSNKNCILLKILLRIKAISYTVIELDCILKSIKKRENYIIGLRHILSYDVSI